MVFVSALNPVLFDLGPVQVRWYGLMWALAFIFTWFYVRRLAQHKALPLSIEDVENLNFAVIIGVVLGARIGHAIIYNPGYFLAYPLKLFALWEGGLSFHGGLVGGILAGFVFARRKQWPLLLLLDAYVVPVAFGLGLGRIGNFFNGELYGNPTNVPWAVIFPGVESARHPSQLYESAYSFLLFGILSLMRKIKRLSAGALTATFLMLYAALRSATEFFRSTDGYTGALSIFQTPSGYIGPLTIGQALNIPVFIAGLALALWLWHLRKKN